MLQSIEPATSHLHMCKPSAVHGMFSSCVSARCTVLFGEAAPALHYILFMPASSPAHHKPGMCCCLACCADCAVDISAEERLLRSFDLATEYGPCTGMTRLERCGIIHCSCRLCGRYTDRHVACAGEILVVSQLCHAAKNALRANAGRGEYAFGACTSPLLH
jgi:hypothetical protein